MNQISFPSLDEASDDQEIAKTTMNYDDNRPIAPTRRVSKQPVPNKMPNNPLDEFEYEEAAPDTNKYGYEEAAPTTSEEAAPAAKYCYEEAEPTTSQQKSSVSRRSSLKSTKSMPVQRRRASMECGRTTMVEVRVRGERLPVQRRRSIEFDKTIQIREVKPVLELAKHDELWLQQEDFVKMKSDRRSVVKKHRLGTAQPLVNDDETIRGLEKYLDKNIRMQKNRAWDTVLLEQDEQELAGYFNEQRIADLYRHTTDSSPEKAAARAKQDQEDVKEYLLSPRTTKLMMRRLSC